MTNSRLFIFIGKKRIPQGKVFKVYGNRWIYLADITEAKFYEKFNRSLAIAVRILEAFAKVKINVSILYRWKEKGIVYWTRRSDFYKYGILRADGDHRQLLLPVNKWRVWKEPLNEPFNLPDVSVDRWAKDSDYERRVEDYSMPVSVFARLKEKYPEVVAKVRG